jgi:hypothetical protein
MEQTLARTAEIIRRDDSFIDGCVQKILRSPQIQKTQQEISFSASYFSSLHEARDLPGFQGSSGESGAKDGRFFHPPILRRWPACSKSKRRERSSACLMVFPPAESTIASSLPPDRKKKFTSTNIR